MGDLLHCLFYERKDVFNNCLCPLLTWMDMYVLRCVSRTFKKEFRVTKEFNVWLECARNGSPAVWTWLRERNPKHRCVYDIHFAAELGKRGDLEMLKLTNPVRFHYVLADAAAHGHIHVIKDWIANHGMEAAYNYAREAAGAGNAEILRLIDSASMNVDEWNSVIFKAISENHVDIVREFHYCGSHLTWEISQAKTPEMLELLHEELKFPLEEGSFTLCTLAGKEWLWQRGRRPSVEYMRDCARFNKVEVFQFLRQKNFEFDLQKMCEFAVNWNACDTVEYFLSLGERIDLSHVSVDEDREVCDIFGRTWNSL